jgi:hypothetical protein
MHLKMRALRWTWIWTSVGDLDLGSWGVGFWKRGDFDFEDSGIWVSGNFEGRLWGFGLLGTWRFGFL